MFFTPNLIKQPDANRTQIFSLLIIFVLKSLRFSKKNHILNLTLGLQKL